MYKQNNEILSERKRIGDALKTRRKTVGLTQVELAEMLDITQQRIQAIENGKYSTGFDVLQNIASCLDAQVDLVETKYTKILRKREH